MIINAKKTKQMLIHFGKLQKKSDVPLLTADDAQIERVETFQLLGVVFSSDLSWNHHVSYMLNKVSKRYYIIYHVQRVSAKHGVKDDFAFLWEHAIFRHPPNKNPLTDRSEILHS
jgi:hypothetical protein